MLHGNIVKIIEKDRGLMHELYYATKEKGKEELIRHVLINESGVKEVDYIYGHTQGEKFIPIIREITQYNKYGKTTLEYFYANTHKKFSGTIPSDYIIENTTVDGIKKYTYRCKDREGNYREVQILFETIETHLV